MSDTVRIIAHLDERWNRCLQAWASIEGVPKQELVARLLAELAAEWEGQYIQLQAGKTGRKRKTARNK